MASVPASLQTLVDDGVVESVHSRLMSGKEASVFVVGYRGEWVAAKVYKAREHRTFKATSAYTEGRNQTRNTRDKRAMERQSVYGRQLVEESWREMEFNALSAAFYGGVRVPKPIMIYDDILLMELVVDAEGVPAPRLADYKLAPEDAEAMLRAIHEQARLLLATGKVHGDLSAFNVLIAHDGPMLIDLPQVVDASGNNQAGAILRRDLANIAEFLAKYDARLLRFRDAGAALWQHFQRGTLDRAVEPAAGSVRSGDQPQGGRRAREAERGRMHRGKQPPRDPSFHAPRDGSRPSGPAARPQGPNPDRRPPNPDRRPPNQDRRPPNQDRRPSNQDYRAPNQDRRPSNQDYRAPNQDRRPSNQDYRAPNQDRRPSNHDQRGPHSDRRPAADARPPNQERRGPDRNGPPNRQPQTGQGRSGSPHRNAPNRNDRPPRGPQQPEVSFRRNRPVDDEPPSHRAPEPGRRRGRSS